MDDVFKYTGRGNLVAVVTNGTVVLGLGNIGPEAGKPVMEGKGVLFKVFADVDVFDIEIAERDPEKLCAMIKALEPTFGGINLEDIKSPECFEIEDRLKREMSIPVFHDDQHGTAIISAAGLLNALEIAGKRIEDCRFVISGAGAAAIATGRLYKLLGADPEKIALFDTKGHVHRGRKDLNPQKLEFAGKEAYPSMAEAMRGADVFLGLSAKDIGSEERVTRIAERQKRLQLVNRLLAPTGAKLRDFNVKLILQGPTGQTKLVDDLAHVWLAADAIGLRPVDPLDDDFIDSIRGQP